MYRVLVPLDSNRDRKRGQVTALTTMPLDPSETEVVLTHVLTDDAKQAPKEIQRAERVDVIKEARATLEDQDFSVTVRSLGSPPKEGILELADKIDADHIVLGGRKRSPTGKMLFGSVTQSIILGTDLPVTVTGGVPDDARPT